jgi:predicted nucleic acid-binding protein
MTLVFNASPLIVLAKAGLIDRFLALADSVIIPGPVMAEVCRVDDQRDPARLWMQDVSHQRFIQEAPDIPPSVRTWDLGAGEAAVLSIAAKISNATAVLDDLAARRCANSLGLRVVGTLGLVLMAKKQGMISSARQAIETIAAAGLFVSARHITAICKQAGE